ncbi:MAG: membrane protein insertase YidC, partial [Planctomycetota bacterium]
MEKRLVLFLVLTFGIVILWLNVVPQPKPDKETPSKETPEAPGENPAENAPGPDVGPGEPGETPEPGPESDPGAGTPDPEGDTGLPVSVRPPADSEIVVDAEDRRVRWTLDRWGGSLKQVEFKEFSDQPGQDPVADPSTRYRLVSKNLAAKQSSQAPRMLAVDIVNGDGRALFRGSRVLWDVVEQTEDRVVFRLELPKAGAALVKTFEFPRTVEGVEGGAWHLDFDLALEVTDPAKAALFCDRSGAESWRIRLTGPSGVAADPATSLGLMLQVEALKIGEVNGEYWRPPSKPTSPEKVFPEASDQAAGDRVDWLAYHNRFFTGALRPYDPVKTDAYRTLTIPIEDLDYEGREKIVNAVTALEFKLPLTEEGSRPSRRFMFYAGPMDPTWLRNEPYEHFEYLVDYGMFGIPRLLLNLLGLIQGLTVNWGIAIIVLTIIVRLGMFPISRKSQLATQRYSKKMARLKPKMDVIKEKHAENKKKQQEEMMKLYREEGVRPPLGCLLMFLQMPIFIGLFIALRKSIELRHSAFLWAEDLAGPDMMIPNLLTDHSIPLVSDPFHFNLLPILMGISWFFSAAMAPKPADPQQQSMHRMMKWMPVLFTLMLYNYAAGLALYMTVSSV